MTSTARPWFLLGFSALVAGILVLPPIFLVVETWGAGISDVSDLIFRELTAKLLRNTVELTACVTALSAAIGTLTAWLVERTDLPLRRLWAGLVAMPLAIPDFVVAFGWSSRTTFIEGFHGAVIVMTLALYPLVYLPVSASFRNADPGQEEVARSLGVGRLATFLRVTLGQARGAILGGCLLVALVVFSEFGAFEIINFTTFSTEIYVAFSVAFNVPAAAALSLVLVLLSMVVVAGEGRAAGREPVVRLGPLAQRRPEPHRLGRWRVAAIAWFLALFGLAVCVPVSSTAIWMRRGTHFPIPWGGLWRGLEHTLLFSIPAAALATVMAAPVALLATRHPRGAHRLLERSTYFVLAMPSMIAFSLSYFTGRYVHGFAYQSAPLLVVAYAVLFFPFALVAVRASAARAPASLEEAGRSLGRRQLVVFCRVTLPMIAPGLAAGFCLVFLSSVIELTTTLILIPTGVQTLSTQFWIYQQSLSYGQAAPFALAMIAVAALPTLFLVRFFSRTAVTI